VGHRVAGGLVFWDAAPVLTCEECACTSTTGKGWRAYIVEDPDGEDEPITCTYCPPCAERELNATPLQGYV
jgi:hypothetical protein